MPLKENNCDHLVKFELKKAKAQACEECEKIGGKWVHLRTCQTCGETLCCDSSPNKHATKHFGVTGHPVVISSEPGENWAWCYEHNEIKMKAY